MRNSHTSKQQTTGVQVQNVSGATQTITINYSTGQTANASVADGASHTFFTPNDLPAGTLASATLTGSGPMVAVVNDKGVNTSNPQRVTTYSCFSATQASTTVQIPLYKEYLGGNTTGIQVQNVAGDGSMANVTLTYSTNTGKTVVVQTTAGIADGASKTFFGISQGATSGITITQGSAADLNNTFGGVLITSDQPIVAIANESTVSGTVQDTKNYEGFNQ